jgi:heme exporter protein C
VRRLAEPGRQAARFAAVVGIFGFVDVPIVYFSVTWWKTVHPGPVVGTNALPPQMLAVFLLTLACTLVLAAVIVAIRYRIEALLDERLSLAAPIEVVASARPEAAQ